MSSQTHVDEHTKQHSVDIMLQEIPSQALFAPLEFKEQTLSSHPQAAAAGTEDKSSHLETWTPGMLDHQGSGMHTLCLIIFSEVHVKVADVT